MRSTSLPTAAGLVLLCGIASAHPMGNLSINHYARLEPGAQGIAVTYVLDLAEIPTFELTQTWNTPQGTAKAILDRRAAEQARAWAGNLVFAVDGKQLTPQVESTSLTIIDGAGNLPVFRIATTLHLDAAPGKLEYEDHNFATRAGWREIVIRATDGAVLLRSSAGSRDISQALTAYPQDPTKAPPQDMEATFEWRVFLNKAPELLSKAPAILSTTAPNAAPQAPAPPVVAAPDVAASRPPEAPSLGTVKRDDAISRILRSKTLSWNLLAILIGLAFWFGALHALEPGHGKTMVAAYLVGERGTAKHAVLLGGMVTFTHTISVFAMGLAAMFLSRYVMPDKISKVLGIVSGLSIVWIGGVMLRNRAKSAGADHEHSYEFEGEGTLTLGNLLVLGASGGLIPCPSALILLLSAISIGRPGLGVLLLVVFSLGLAVVLTSTGLLVLYARNLIPAGERRNNAFFRWMPVASAAAIVVIGVLMTGVSLGWIPVRLALG